MKIAISSTNTVTFTDIHAADGVAITAYSSVTCSILNASTRSPLTGASALTMTAISGQSNAYAVNVPSSVELSASVPVIVQVTLVATAGTSGTRVIESEEITPSRT